MDQGSVVVLCRRTTHLEFVVMSSVHRDLNYSGLNPTATNILIPDPAGIPLNLWAPGQGSVLVVGNKLEVMYFTTRSCPINLIV